MTATGLLHEQLFERTNEPAYLMDPERGRILAANDAGCAMLGYARAELLEEPVAQIHPAELGPLSRDTAAAQEPGAACADRSTRRRHR